MNMYNLLHGRNPLAELILSTLGLTANDVGRFRDCFVADGEIAVYTRNGGGNRQDYQHVFDALATHSCYLRDTDDDFDSTYATVYFKFPDRYAEFLAAIDTGKFDPSQRWLDYFEKMKQPDYVVPEAVKALTVSLKEWLENDPRVKEV
jgi:hypothetical protein